MDGHPRNRYSCRTILTIVFLLFSVALVFAQSSTQIVETPIGTCFQINPAFTNVISEQVKSIRELINTQRNSGQFVAYISTPLSGKGGGNRDVNIEISHFMAKRVAKRFGGRIWALDPANFDLPPVGKQMAGGSEYMYMWTSVLAGADGLGKDFNLFVVTGPSDVRDYFAEKIPAVTNDIVGGIDTWINDRASENPGFKLLTADKLFRMRFLQFYVFKASSAFSLGAHDEWNVFAEIDSKIRHKSELGIAEQIPMIFDGRYLSPAEMETHISEGNTIHCSIPSP